MPEPAAKTPAEIALAAQYLSVLSDLLSLHEGEASLQKPVSELEYLCDQASTALGDLVWQEEMENLRDYSFVFFAGKQHTQWAKADLTGLEYLRVQIIKTLNRLSTRLAVLNRMRAARAQPQEHQPA